LRDPKVRALLQKVCREVKELDSAPSHPRISPRSRAEGDQTVYREGKENCCDE
jgi:hypothetical protein